MGRLATARMSPVEGWSATSAVFCLAAPSATSAAACTGRSRVVRSSRPLRRGRLRSVATGAPVRERMTMRRDGVPATGSPWWVDSLDVPAGAVFEIAFVADNPGIWADHCHNLPHAAEGLVALAGRVRRLREQGLAEAPGTRLLVATARLVAAGIPPVDACRAALAGPLTDDPDLLAAIADLVEATL